MNEETLKALDTLRENGRVICHYCYKVLTGDLTIIEPKTLKDNNMEWKDIEGMCLKDNFDRINKEIPEHDTYNKEQRIWQSDGINVKKLSQEEIE